MHRRDFLCGAALGLSGWAHAGDARRAASAHTARVSIDVRSEQGALPHYWENCVGSDRLAVGLREQWLRDLAAARELCGFRSVRCHGLFDDEMGICQGVGESGPITSFVYLDQIYDRLLEIGVKPFVELSFMPSALASSRNAVFWYRGNTSPPRDIRLWEQLVDAFAGHLIERYGIAEVSQWRFECWNEPNLPFWAGSQAEYFDFYRHTARALKGVHADLQVGGPATAEMMWLPDFLAYCAREAAPIDFVTSHIYADDPQENIFGRADQYPFEEVIPRALKQAQEQIAASHLPRLPLLVTEWSSQSPAFIAKTVNDCIGLAETFSYWTFDSVFEEQGPPRAFFNSAYGLIGQSGVPRPSLHAFTALHRLGSRRLTSTAGPVLATRREDGACVVLAWNAIPRTVRNNAGDPLAAFEAEVLAGGPVLPMQLLFPLSMAGTAQVTVVDPLVASARPAWMAMGQPSYPTRGQIAELRERAAMPAARAVALQSGSLRIDVPANGLVLIELPPT
jgi:xylan 1,4-beta-xylosidase